MSTLTTSVRHHISTQWIVGVIAALVVAAVAATLFSVLGGSSASGSSRTGLFDNSDCRATTVQPHFC